MYGLALEKKKQLIIPRISRSRSITSSLFLTPLHSLTLLTAIDRCNCSSVRWRCRLLSSFSRFGTIFVLPPRAIRRITIDCQSDDAGVQLATLCARLSQIPSHTHTHARCRRIRIVTRLFGAAAPGFDCVFFFFSYFSADQLSVCNESILISLRT